jgi:hypothetical protein
MTKLEDLVEFRKTLVQDDAKYRYLTSLINYCEANGSLSARLELAFNVMKNKASEPPQQNAWRENFTEEMREKMRVVAHYYRNHSVGESRRAGNRWSDIPPGNEFRELAGMILADPDYIPPRKKYNAMCNNHYAKKILKSHFSIPRFSVGDLVVPRVKCPYVVKQKLIRGAYVVQANSRPVTSAAKSTKWYSLIPIGQTGVVDAEERWLKKARA